MTIYTDSLSNIKRYKDDYFTVAVSSTLSFDIQSKLDAWFIDLAPSKSLGEKLDKGLINWNEFCDLYKQEMNNTFSKSKIKWIREYSNYKDIVILCFEEESMPKCHRHVLKEIIEK